jgi:hypothetical protein
LAILAAAVPRGSDHGALLMLNLNGVSNSVLMLVSGVFLVIAVALMGDAASRFTKGPADFWTMLVVAAAAILTFLQGGALISAITDAVKKPNGSGTTAATAKVSVFLSLVVFVVVLIGWLLLHAVARWLYYPPYGEVATPLAIGSIMITHQTPATQAIDSYQHAVALDANFQGAYQRMGLAYEDIGDLEKAITAFEAAYRLSAVAADYQPVAPIISRTWVMMRRGDYVNVLAPIDEGFRALDELDLKIDKDTKASVDEKQRWRNDNQATRYQLLNNRAWANLGLKHLRAAEADAREAEALYPNSRVPHCLLAHIAEAQRDDSSVEAAWTSQAILEEWRMCLHASEPFLHRIEPQWLATARERLRAAGIPE